MMQKLANKLITRGANLDVRRHAAEELCRLDAENKALREQIRQMTGRKQ